MLPEIRQERRTRYAVVFGSSDKRKPALFEDVGMYGEKRNSEFADMCRARRLSTFRPILSAPERRYLSTAVFLSDIPWHLGLAIRLVRPAYRAHVMVPFAELEGRLEY